MVRFSISLCLLLACFFVRGQYAINGTIIGVQPEKILLLKTYGSNQSVIDSTRIDETGSFSLKIPVETKIGQYQILTESGVSFDWIFNEENIRFIMLHDGYDQQVQIIESDENKVYYEFVNLMRYNLLKLDIISTVIDYYPREDLFYQQAVDKALELRAEIETKAIELIGNNPTLLASHFIKASNPVFADLDLSETQRKNYLKGHYFDYIDFNDTLLINSQTFNSKIINYLTLFQDKSDDRETFENNLLAGVDSILLKSSVNEITYAYIIDFLIGGFEAIGFERGLEHIAVHNKLDDFCVNTERVIDLQDKIEFINKLAIGKQAPNFTGKDMDGHIISLNEIISKRTLLFFWASWCPHCKDMISEINKIYQFPETEIKVVGISIDTSRSELSKVINEHKINWPVIAEFEGWDGQIPNMYGIAATPSIFLLDENKTIVAKPTSLSALKKYSNSLLNP